MSAFSYDHYSFSKGQACSHSEFPAFAEMFEDQRSLLIRVRDVFLSILREIVYIFESIQGRFLASSLAGKMGIEPFYDDYSKKWKESSEGLYVMIHGLLGHPCVWRGHLSYLKKNQQNFDTFVPFVNKEGNCCLEEAADIILEKVTEYARAHPNKPICLLGVSNGARIATYIEIQLRKTLPSAKVIVSSVAGVHFGSQTLDNLSQHRMTRRLSEQYYQKNVREELSFGSPRARQLLDEIRAPLGSEAKRAYYFYASTEDSLATHRGTSLPFVGFDKEAIYNIFHGFQHGGVLKGVKAVQLSHATKKMNSWR